MSLVLLGNCRVCGNEMCASRRTTRKYCNEKCKARSPERMEYSRQYLRSEKSRERHRGYDRDRYANNPERREYNLALAKKFRQENPDKMSDYVKKRRAKVTQVTVEDVDSQTVYERDNWTCGICGEPVDRLLKWPHEQYPSLDHITPISKGGEHSYANTQLAHLVCNMRKGARLDLTEAP